MNNFLRYGFTAIALVFVFSAFAATETNAQINEILKRMDEHYKALKSLQANVSNAQYLWSTGATGQTISVIQTGAYWVQVNNGACTVTDTINVNFSAPPVLSLGNDTTLCPGQQLLLNPGGVAKETSSL